MEHMVRFGMHIMWAFLLCGFAAAALDAYGQDGPAPVMRAVNLFTLRSDFDKPSDVVAGTNGTIYVLDGVNNTVKVFDAAGVFQFAFGEAGSQAGRLSFPLGIGIDTKNNIYIADSGNHRVQVFGPEGTYRSQFSTDTGRAGFKPSDPTDVVMNERLNRCYVVDNDNHCVLVYDAAQGTLAAHGAMGMDKKGFRFPFMATIDQAGMIYVVEVINTRVKVLDAQAGYVSTIGGWGVKKGEFYRPKGVAVDERGSVFVSDSYLGVVQVFDSAGTLLAVLADEQGAVLKFKTPTGLFVAAGRLYVVEMLADQVQVLALKN